MIWLTISLGLDIAYMDELTYINFFSIPFFFYFFLL